MIASRSASITQNAAFSHQVVAAGATSYPTLGGLPSTVDECIAGGSDRADIASASTATGAFPLFADSKDAAIVITLMPGHIARS